MCPLRVLVTLLRDALDRPIGNRHQARILFLLQGAQLQHNKAQLAIEQELPTFVSRLGGMLLVTAAPRTAVEEVTGTLLEGRPLRVWLERLQYVGMCLLLTMMAIAMYNDVAHRLG